MNPLVLTFNAPLNNLYVKIFSISWNAALSFSVVTLGAYTTPEMTGEPFIQQQLEIPNTAISSQLNTILSLAQQVVGQALAQKFPVSISNPE